MKKNKNIISAFFAFSLLVFLTGCASNTEEVTTDSAVESAAEVEVTYSEDVVEGATELYAVLSIEGMACEMMCGSKISSTLADLDGVESTDIEFNGVDEENFAMVEYNGNKISEQNLISAVQALANGHYKVKTVNVSLRPVEEVEQAEEKVSMYKPTLEYKMPNVFSALVRLF